MKAIVFPSADHSKSETEPGASVSGTASPPSGRISQTWRFASPASSALAPGRGRSERKATQRPSGDQRGVSSPTGDEARARASPPAAGTSQTSVW